MKWVVFILFVTVFAGCGNYNVKKIEVGKEFGTFHIILPVELTSNYRKVKEHNDCCHRQFNLIYYNASESISPYEWEEQFKDTIVQPFIWYGFEVIPPPCKGCYPFEYTMDEFMEILRQKQLQENAKTEIIHSTVEKINGKEYGIFSTRSIWDNYTVEVLEAYTVIEGELFEFRFRRINEGETDFIDRMLESLRTMEYVD